MTSVPKLWPNSTIVCLGCGPSLTQADVDVCRGHAPVIAVNDAYRLAPWADVLYACDGKFWDYYQGVPLFTGLKYGLTVKLGKWPGVERLANTGVEGIELQPTGLRSGSSSGYQAINLAVHLGASRILLLGYDYQLGRKGQEHFFGRHPNGLRVTSDLPAFARRMRGLVAPLKELGIEVINCSRETALPWFPRMSLEQAFARQEALAS